MKSCDHNQLFSGRTNLERKFEWICRTCGEMGWSDTYTVARVDQNEFYAQRVIHGWAGPRAPMRLTPPRMPTNTAPVARSAWPFVPGVVFFTTLAVLCALASIPWGKLGPIMPMWTSMLGSGIALGTATVCYVCWKRGL
jgi:hypothetical protein